MIGLNPDGIPGELRDLPQWVAWRLEQRDGKPTKVPYRADGGGRASSTNPATWSTFADAVDAADRLSFDGVGFVFADDPFCGIDLDAALPLADRGAIAVTLDSYTETSISGTGWHVIVRAKLPAGARNRKGPFEVYDQARFFVMTGAHVRGTPTTIESRQAELEEVLAEYLPAPEPAPPRPVTLVALDDQELLERAFAARNGFAFRRLYDGDTSGYPSRSEADLAFCRITAFWVGRDPVRIDAWLRSSNLMREKWLRDDYREETIAKAITGTTDVYSPKSRRNCVRASDAVDSEARFGAPQGVSESNGSTASALIEAVDPTPNPDRERRELSQETVPDSDPGSGHDHGRPFSMPISEFVALERTLAEPLLADEDSRAVIGRRSLVLLGALGGHGKTTFFVDVALHLAAGVDYPPFTVPRPVSILMIENEGPEELFAEKLKARLASFPHELRGRLDIFTFDWGGFSLAEPAFRERLAAEIADKQYDLVFGDPLDSLGIEGVGSPEDTRLFMALMKEAGLHKNVAWWLNTHPRKEETKEALNEIAGAWGGKPDSVLLLRMLDDDRTQLRFPKLRWTRRGTRPPILLGFDVDTEAFTFLGEQAEEKREYLREVFALLQSRGWLTVKEIAAPAKDGGIGANSTIVKRLLEEHPELFESRTGDDAVALNRKSTATLWGLLPDAAEKLAADGVDEQEAA